MLTLLAALSIFTAPDPQAEAALEARSEQFSARLHATVARIEADLAGPGSDAARRAAALERIEGLRPELEAYRAAVLAGYDAVAETEPAERRAEVRGYGDALARYVAGLPDELTRQIEAEIQGAR